MNVAQQCRQAIAKQLARLDANIAESHVLSSMGIPKMAAQHQFRVPIPKLYPSKESANPMEIVHQFKRDHLIERATVLGPFIHFDVQKDKYIRETLKQVFQEKSRYGWIPSAEGKKPTVVIDYSSPNIAKPFHAGHLRSTIIGNFIKRVHEAMGYRAIGINYLGDWGKQYGLLAVGFQRYGDTVRLEQDPIRHLYDVYVKINHDALNDTTIDTLANQVFCKMENGDQDALAQWRQFRELSIASYKPIYKRLNIQFESYSGESETEAYLGKAMDRLQKLGLVTILENQQGALAADLDVYGLGKPILQRADGTSLYLTRDIATAIMRHQKYSCDKAIYVVGTEQELHLKQVFKLCELMGEPYLMQHVNFGRVQGMSTRKGSAIFLEDILDMAREKMRENMLKESNQFKLQELFSEGVDGFEGQEAIDHVADRLGTSAVIIQDLVSKRIKNYSFSWDRMISSRGYTGVYLQFTYARLCGIERKTGVPISTQCDMSLLVEKEAFDLAIAISQFPDMVQLSAKHLEPSTLVQYLFKLCHAASQANAVLRVKDVDLPLAQARMLLFWAARKTLGNGLWLLGIDPLERM